MSTPNQNNFTHSYMEQLIDDKAINHTKHILDQHPYDRNITDPLGEISNSTNASSICYDILYQAHGNLNLRYWDILIIIPNIVLFILITYKIYPRIKAALISSSLSHATSPIIATFLYPIYIISAIQVLRFLYLYTAIGLSGNDDPQNQPIFYVDRYAWLIIKFSTFALELFVLFHSFIANPEDRRSVIKVIIISVGISFICFLFQAIGENRGVPGYIQEIMQVRLNSTNLRADFFWCCVTTLMSLIYFLIGTISNTFHHSASVKNFSTVYIWTMSLINLSQAIAHLMLWHKQISGICMISLTNYGYFGLYMPIVYYFYIRGQITTGPTGLMFSYKESNLNELHCGEDGESNENSIETSSNHVVSDQRRITISTVPLVNTKSINSEFSIHKGGPLFNKKYLDSASMSSNSIVVDDITKTHA